MHCLAIHCFWQYVHSSHCRAEMYFIYFFVVLCDSLTRSVCYLNLFQCLNVWFVGDITLSFVANCDYLAFDCWAHVD